MSRTWLLSGANQGPLLSAAESPTCADICKIAADHLKEVELKINDLKRLAFELRRIGYSCNGKRSSANCRLIASLTIP
jgi:hypothetical protein